MGTSLHLIGRVIFKNKFTALFIASAISLIGCNKPAALLEPPGTAPAPAPVAAHAPAPTPAPAAAPGQPAGQVKVEPNSSTRKNLAIVRVYYATDRSRASQSEHAKTFGSRRGPLSYGSCEISVPVDQKLGKPEHPPASKLGPKETVDKQPALRKVVPREYDAYLDNLRAVIAKSPKKSAFVFVHGYNVSFADAARRTAQMKYDLGFDGAPIFFSWPSKGRSDSYAADEADVEWAQPDLKEFLKDLAGKTKARNIYLIAHSMGNRALTKAYIYLISERPELKQVFREVILVAPDIDSDVFKRDIAPALATSANRTTLYSSSKDYALRASNRFQNYPRAGDSGDNLVLFEGIETIDATNVNTGLTGHSYLADNSSVIADIHRLIQDGKRPAERHGLKTVNAPSGQYWRFKIQKMPLLEPTHSKD